MLSRVFLLFTALFATALSFDDINSDSVHLRDLKAARSHGSLLSRSNTFSLKREVVLTYTEDLGYAKPSSRFTSRVRLESHRDTLLLEEIDHLLESVECSDDAVTVVFRERAFLENSVATWKSLEGGLLISSHSSCSEDGAHSVFQVAAVIFDLEEPSALVLVERATWVEAFHSRKIEFGDSTEPHYLHRHDRLSRRNILESATGAVVAAATGLIPTSTPQAESVTIDLTDNQEDTTFEFPEGANAPQVPFTVGCQKCTTKGSLVLTQGEIALTDVQDIVKDQLLGKEQMDFVESGFFDFELNGFESSVLLKVIPSASAEFTFDLFNVQVVGFRIPGFGSAGVSFKPQLVFDIAVEGGVELTWGFDVKVPDGSNIRLDIGEFNNSEVTGFDGTTIEPLEFNANSSDVEFTVNAGLRSLLPMGISFFDEKIKLLGGPVIDLPFINSTITQISTSDANANCTGTNEDFKNDFQNATQITSDLVMGIGFEFDANIDLLPDGHWRVPLWEKSLPLPTTCFAWKEGQFVAAVEVAGAAGRIATPSILVLAAVAAVFIAM